MARRGERDLERHYPRAAFTAKLRRLADALDAGHPFTIRVGGERLHVPADATFNVEHERVAGGEELEFQLLWRSGDRRPAPGRRRPVSGRRGGGAPSAGRGGRRRPRGGRRA